MAQDRILIDGVWYVKEQPVHVPLGNVVEFEGLVYENDSYCWNITRIKQDADTFLHGVDIEFTDKRSNPWKEESWDNDAWILGVWRNDAEALKHAYESMDYDGIRTFQALVQLLIDKNWLQAV